MPDNDITVSAVLGLAPLSEKDNTFRRDSLDKAIASVRGVAKAVSVLGPWDIATSVVQELVRVLSTPVSQIAVNAWNKRTEMRKYGDPQAYPPDETHHVTLYEHEITQTIRPKVEVLITGLPPVPFVFPCSVVLTFSGAQLVIRGGKATHVELGKLTASWTLSLETAGGTAHLIDKNLKTWTLPGRIPLGNGIPLGRAADEGSQGGGLA
jgi:hypothetical protein